MVQVCMATLYSGAVFTFFLDWYFLSLKMSCLLVRYMAIWGQMVHYIGVLLIYVCKYAVDISDF